MVPATSTAAVTADVPALRSPLCRRIRFVGHQDDTGAKRLCLSEPQRRLAVTVEEPLALPKHDRKDQQRVLVNQVVLTQGLDQFAAAQYRDVLARLPLQL